MTSILHAALLLLGLAGTAAAQQPAPVKVNWGHITSTAYYWDVAAAIDLGFMTQEGLAVNAIRIDTASQSIQTLVTGAVDIVSVPAELAISAAEKGADVVIIGTETAKTAFSLITAPSVRSYADLRGKSIAVTQLNEAVATMTRLLLKKRGLDPSDYELVALGASPTRFAALANGAVASAVLGQPLDFKALGAGMNKLGDTFEAFEGPYIVFASSRAWTKANPDATARFLRATAKASRWLYNPQNKDAAVKILVKATKSSPEDAAQTYDFYFGPHAVMSMDLGLTPADLAPYFAIRNSSVAPAKFIDTTYLAASRAR